MSIHESSHAVAAIIYSVPVVRVTIDSATPHLLRAHYRAPLGIGLEAICVLALAGPVGEQHFCGAANDGSDESDYRMAREYLRRAGFNLLEVEAEIVRYRASAKRLVTSERRRITTIAERCCCTAV